MQQLEEQMASSSKAQELSLKTMMNSMDDHNDNLEKLKKDLLKKLDRSKEYDQKFSTLKQEITNGILSPSLFILELHDKIKSVQKSLEQENKQTVKSFEVSKSIFNLY